MANKTSKKQESSYLDIIKTFAIAVLIALVFRSFAYQPFHIPSSSMYPNLLIGDYLFVSKYSYGYSRWSFPFGLNLFDGRIGYNQPKRGDIVVFRPPRVRDGKDTYIKRLVGLPGERVQVIGSQLIINDQVLDTIADATFISESDLQEFDQFIETLPEGNKHYILNKTNSHPLDNTVQFVVPEDHFFFMGDNRDQSQDSRSPFVGFVHKDNLIGRAEFVLFSFRDNFFEFWNWRYDRFFTSLRSDSDV